MSLPLKNPILKKRSDFIFPKTHLFVFYRRTFSFCGLCIDANDALRKDENLTFIDFLNNVESLAVQNLMRDRFVTQAILHPGYRPKVFDLVQKLMDDQNQMCVEMAEKDGIEPEYALLAMKYLYSTLNAYTIMSDEKMFHSQMESLRKFWRSLQEGKTPKPTWEL